MRRGAGEGEVEGERDGSMKGKPPSTRNSANQNHKVKKREEEKKFY